MFSLHKHFPRKDTYWVTIFFLSLQTFLRKKGKEKKTLPQGTKDMPDVQTDYGINLSFQRKAILRTLFRFTSVDGLSIEDASDFPDVPRAIT